MAAVSKIIAVRGKVQNVTNYRPSIWFIKFQRNLRGQFVGIVKAENTDAVTDALGGNIKSALTGKNVELRGEIAPYDDKKLGIQIPEIVITSGSGVRVVE